eukprot:GHVO01018264.1.p1 GENE.GHVO01018264.1~~GHVO01018264.1.p1  ORF type:complete len:658 (+),score=97.75 GHVO01018264.1:75-2048(+)
MTVVVCPTVSLLNDQLSKLPTCLRGVRLDHSVSPQDRLHLVDLIQSSPGVDILITTPEQICTKLLQNALTHSHLRVGLLCLDEAHCISEWGHSFRPSYLRVVEVCKSVLQIPRILALTATANHTTLASIRANMDMETRIIKSDGGVLRDNLQFSVTADRGTDNYSMVACVKNILKQSKWKRMKSIIVYVWKQYHSEMLSQELSRCTESTVAYYHGGMMFSERQKIQEGFMNGKCKYLVATMALGIGIDKKNVDGVLHASMPSSLEQYVQETGRCNRDGLSAGMCHLLLRNEDYRQRYQQIAGSCHDPVALRIFTHALFRLAFQTSSETQETHASRIVECDEAVPYAKLLLLTRDEVLTGTNTRNEDELNVVLNAMDAAMQSKFRRDGVGMFELVTVPFKALELRCFSEDLVNLGADRPFLKEILPLMKCRQGVYNLEITKAMAATGLDGNEIEHEILRVTRDAGVTCVRNNKNSCLIIFKIHRDAEIPAEEDIDSIVNSVSDIMQRATSQELQRLNSALDAFGATDLRERVEEYFLIEKETKPSKAIPAPWQELSLEPLDSDALESDARSVLRAIAPRQTIVWATIRRPLEVLDSKVWYGSSYVTPVMLARILCGLSTYIYNWKSRIPQWNSQRNIRFDELLDFCTRFMTRSQLGHY